MLSKLIRYVKLLGLTTVCVFVLNAFGLLRVTQEVSWARFVVPVIEAVVISSMAMLVGTFIRDVVNNIDDEASFLLAVIVTGFFSWVSLKLCQFVLTSRWMSFDDGLLAQILMGIVFVIPVFVVRIDEKRKAKRSKGDGNDHI